MDNLLNTAVAGIFVVFVAFFGANAAHSAGCSNQTIHVDGELVYVSSKCTWNDAPASQELLDQMTWGANLADTDNGPEADVVSEEQVVLGNGLTREDRIQNRRLRSKLDRLRTRRNVARENGQRNKQRRLNGQIRATRSMINRK